jgi:phosphoglycerate kinase
MYFRLKDFDLQGKRVLLRADFNVPVKDNKITDDSRIKKTIPTIEYILDKNPRQLILISHFGRPEGDYDPEFSLRIVYERLRHLLGKEIYFETNPRINNIPHMTDAKIVMLENLRFDKVETDNDEEFSKKLASFADVFVFDAFGASHRPHASVVGVEKFIPSCAGLLMENEIKYLRDDMRNPEKPFIAIIGGAKSDKISVITRLIETVDMLIIGGVLANTFLKASGKDIGSSKFSTESLEFAKQVLTDHPDKIALPVDFIIADKFAADAKTKIAGINENIDGWMIMDIGPYTISGYLKLLEKAKTVVWAGPIGVFEFEAFRRGTWDIAKKLSELHIMKIVGGGDSADAIETMGLADRFTHISTGGGASLELLSGAELPGIKALEENYEKFKK